MSINYKPDEYKPDEALEFETGFDYPVEQLPDTGKIFIYGTGTSAQALYAWLIKCRTRVEVLGFIDSRQSGSLFGLPVFPLKDFEKNHTSHCYDEILIASESAEEILQQLMATSIPNYRSITPPIYLLANILHDPDIDYQYYLSITHSRTVKQEKNLHLFFGENQGKFVGNNKYFFLYLRQKLPGKVFWVAEDDAVIHCLEKNDIEVIDSRQDDFIDWLLRASHFYFDKMSWQRSYPWLRYFKARKIHTSHGVGLKYTELMQIPKDFLQRLNSREKKWLEANVMKNDLLLSTSRFYANRVSVPGYGTEMEKISLAGYPKNDVIYQKIEGEHIFTDDTVLPQLEQRKQQGFQIVCYMPTCRHLKAGHDDSQYLDLQKINTFCQQHRLVFVMKSHALTQVQGASNDFSHIYHYDNQKDIYPLFRDCDCLVSDYSSTFSDFLHRGKPIIFYAYDYEAFIQQHNPLQFDYDYMTPGPKASHLEELLYWLGVFLVEGKDDYRQQRAISFDRAYQYKKSGASERLWQDMKKMALVK